MGECVNFATPITGVASYDAKTKTYRFPLITEQTMQATRVASHVFKDSYIMHSPHLNRTNMAYNFSMAERLWTETGRGRNRDTVLLFAHKMKQYMFRDFGIGAIIIRDRPPTPGVQTNLFGIQTMSMTLFVLEGWSIAYVWRRGYERDPSLRTRKIMYYDDRTVPTRHNGIMERVHEICKEVLAENETYFGNPMTYSTGLARMHDAITERVNNKHFTYFCMFIDIPGQDLLINSNQVCVKWGCLRSIWSIDIHYMIFLSWDLY